jgi:hypothetical protein
MASGVVFGALSALLGGAGLSPVGLDGCMIPEEGEKSRSAKDRQM